MELQIGQGALVIYAVLLVAGGAMGYAKAKSRPSLIAGIGSGVAALACLALTFVDPLVGFIAGAILAVLLLGFFGRRFAGSRKFMPGGLMVVASLAVLVALVAAILRARTIESVPPLDEQAAIDSTIE